MLSRILGGLLLLSCLFGSYEYIRANNAVNALSALKTSYTLTAQKAIDDAKAQEAADLKKLQDQSSKALQQATYAKNQAQLAAATYSQKLAQLATQPNLDLGHQCALTPVPSDLLP